MKQANISELKNHLSRYLSFVRNGEVVRILDRDRPIARIVPIDRSLADGPVGTEALAQMERKGLIRRGTGSIDPAILERSPAVSATGAVAALLDERERR